MIKSLLRQCSRFGFVLARKKKTSDRQAIPLSVDQTLVDFYRQFIRPRDLCFDVGANIGSRSDVFLTLGARVICIEPQPGCAEILEEKYRNNRDVVIVAKGLAPEPGMMELSICDTASTISTFSDRWKQGRFSDQKWSSTVSVPVTTMDALVQQFGIPDFCKIDVEGFEYEVLQGLSSPIRVLSFEFTKEFLDDAASCMRHLSSVGAVDFNYCLGDNLTETPQLALPQWGSQETLLKALEGIPDPLLWGDIYARFQQGT